jgi:hypothetical protein
MANDVTVGVVGLNALKRDLTKAAGDRGAINAAFSKAGAAAVAPVAAAVRGALPHQSGTLAGDVRVTATRSGGTVRMGRASVRYAGWVEFGGHRRDPHDSDRTYLAGGRYLFPAARDLAPKALAAYTPALEAALDAYPWTNTTSDGAAVHD